MLSNTFVHYSCNQRLVGRLSVRSLMLTGVFAFAALATVRTLQAQEPKPKVAVDPRHVAFEKQMRSVKLKGHFTIVGSKGPEREEEYVIQSVKKLEAKNKWRFLATIRYGKVNLTLPLVLDVYWAKSTPVITLDQLNIPGLGTFSARVLIHEDRYCGTWQHNDKGGHLFGVIEPVEKQQQREGD